VKKAVSASAGSAPAARPRANSDRASVATYSSAGVPIAISAASAFQ
jgi:hypothetical protein